MEASVATIATVKCTRRCYLKKKIQKIFTAAALVASVATIETVKCKRRCNFNEEVPKYITTVAAIIASVSTIVIIMTIKIKKIVMGKGMG